MKKTFARTLVVVLVLSIIASACSLAVSADDKKNSNRFNLVFAIDASGSMADTDPDELRFEATKQFLSVMADQGNYVGDVVFSKDIVKKQEVVPINGKKDKEKIQKSIETKPKDWTNIGLALKESVDMLDKNGSEALESAVILLSDGKTELGNNDDLEQSQKDKAAAIKTAREKGYKIYTVFLNKGNDADAKEGLKELKQIADATGGTCFEVTNEEKLNSFFNNVRDLIYSTKTNEQDILIPSDGEISYDFDVPNAGVEEVNIIINSENKVSEMELTKPDGSVMSSSEVEKCTMRSASFVVTKISSPEGGDWHLHAKGKPETEIKIAIVPNDCLSVTTEYNKKDSYNKGDTLEVKGYLYNGDEKSTDSSAYEDYEAVLYVKNETAGLEESYVMESDDDCFEYDLPLDEDGTYEAYMSVTYKSDNNIEIMKNTADSPIVVTIENAAPVFDHDVEEHFWLWPFVANSAEINFDGAVKDPDGDKLTYSVESGSFLETSYELDGTTIKMKDFDLPEGTFTIVATDEKGASAKFEVEVSSTNIGIVALIVIGAIALIVLAAIGITTYILLNKRFMGDCYLSSFNNETGEYSNEVKRTKGRGRIRLNAFGLRAPGFETGKVYIQATGKDYVYICSKKPICVDGKTGKKFKVEGMGSQVMITKAMDSMSGFYFKFSSRLNKNAW